MQVTFNRLINWFIPLHSIRGQTNIELARVFVFTHVFGPVIAQPMAIYLYFVSPTLSLPLAIMVFGIWAFWLLPFVLRRTGNLTLSAMLSFQGLTTLALFGTFFYGGLSSPFVPWLIVSLLLGFCYLPKRVRLVLSIFVTDLCIFGAFFVMYGFPHLIPISQLHILGWLSIAAATVYMSWMALFYARIIALRSELEAEAERYRATLKELEKARAVAEQSNRNRSLFFAKMSHELRTPLNSIIGYSEILLSEFECSGAEDAQRSSDLKRINVAGKHLLSLVADVLDLDKMEMGVVSVEPTSFSLGNLCDEVVASALPLVEKNGNSFVLDCPNRVETVHTDRKMLRQMIINLLSNAGKFTEAGTIKLHLGVDPDIGDDRLCISVTDTGIGISPGAIPHLFDDYMQADASIGNKYGGTGIGLALTRKFSVLLGGGISVESMPGKGSRFTIDISANLRDELKERRPIDTGSAEVKPVWQGNAG